MAIRPQKPQSGVYSSFLPTFSGKTGVIASGYPGSGAIWGFFKVRRQLLPRDVSFITGPTRIIVVIYMQQRRISPGSMILRRIGILQENLSVHRI